MILYIHNIYGILYMYITKYGYVFLKLGESIYVAMDLIPILLGSLPLAQEYGNEIHCHVYTFAKFQENITILSYIHVQYKKGLFEKQEHKASMHSLYALLHSLYYTALYIHSSIIIYIFVPQKRVYLKRKNTRQACIHYTHYQHYQFTKVSVLTIIYVYMHVVSSCLYSPSALL